MLLVNKENPTYDLQDFNGMSKIKEVVSAPNNFTQIYKKEAPFLSSSPWFLD